MYTPLEQELKNYNLEMELVHFMKEVVAILRPNKMTQTKEILAALGFPAMTACRVLGRGRQKAIIKEVSFEIQKDELLNKEGSMKYIPKRLISLIVPDEDVSLVVEAIMKVNHTGQIGDGKLFICPVEDAVRVRTKERGENAII